MRHVVLLSLLVAPFPVLAQTVEVDSDHVSIDAGAVKIDAASDVQESGQQRNHASTPGTHSASRQHGTVIESRKTTTKVVGNVTNKAVGPGAVSEQTLDQETVIDTDTTSETQAHLDHSYVNAELDASNFAGQQLARVDFANASLVRADFRKANLEGAVFINADLRDAQLQGANLRDAELANAELDGAKLDGAVWIDGRVCEKGSTGSCR